MSLLAGLVLTVEHAAKERPRVAFAPRGELVAGVVSLPEVRDEHLADGVGAGAAKAKLLELMPEGSDNNRRAESVQCDGRAGRVLTEQRAQQSIAVRKPHEGCLWRTG